MCTLANQCTVFLIGACLNMFVKFNFSTTHYIYADSVLKVGYIKKIINVSNENEAYAGASAILIISAILTKSTTRINFSTYLLSYNHPIYHVSLQSHNVVHFGWTNLLRMG